TVHVDNNHPNQEKSAPLMVQTTAPLAARLPVILVGDFNSMPDTSAYATLVHGVGGAGFAFSDAYDLAALHEVLHNQAQPPAYDPAKRIDHVFLGGPWRVDRWSADLYVYGAQQRYPSDHHAISVHISL